MTRTTQENLDQLARAAAYATSKVMGKRYEELEKMGWRAFSLKTNRWQGEFLAVIGMTMMGPDGKPCDKWLQFDGKLYAPVKGKVRYEWNWDTMAARKIQEIGAGYNA